MNISQRRIKIELYSLIVLLAVYGIAALLGVSPVGQYILAMAAGGFTRGWFKSKIK